MGATRAASASDRRPPSLLRGWVLAVAAAAVVAVPGSGVVAARPGAEPRASSVPVAALAESEGVAGWSGRWADARSPRASATPVPAAGDAAAGVAHFSPVRAVTALGAGGIPEIALSAYVRAAESLAVADAGCGVRWTLLAAIGRVESNHGRFGGAQLRDDGYGTRPIRGIPLDGRPGVARIVDTDGGVLDGDPVHDRAVGPLQFIPSTWRRVAADGNGDGRSDPDNIYDAALAAAVYLCAGDADLRDPGQLTAAVLRYNRSRDYADLVLRLAAAYEAVGEFPLPTPGPAPEPAPVLAVVPPAPASVGGLTPGSSTSTSGPMSTTTTDPAPTAAPGATTTTVTPPRECPPATTEPPTTAPATTEPTTTVPDPAPPTTTEPATTDPATTVPDPAAPTTTAPTPTVDPPCG